MVRRGRGEGNISHRDDGRWEARLTLADGKRKSFYGKTRKEVAAKLRDALADQARGLTIAPEKLTVAQYLEQWLADIAQRVDPSTHIKYSLHVRQYLSPGLGKTLLARLSAQDVQRLYTDLASHLSPTTIRLTHTTLHGVLDQALRLGLVQQNVSERVTLPRLQKHEMQPLSEAEANQFLEACAGHSDEALFVLAVTTGMRQGELLGLRWQDVDLDKGELTVVMALQEYRGDARRKSFRLAAPKTARSRRKIALSKTVALPALRAHRRRQREGRLVIGPDWQDQGLVFPDGFGEIRMPQTVYYQFKKLLKRAGLPDIRFHDLRHTAATILLLRGVNVKLVSEMLGHADIALTLRVYGHLLPHTHEQAAAMMDEVFKRKA